MMDMMILRSMMMEAHDTAKSKGWYDNEVLDGVIMCNLISELMEAWNEYTHNRGVAEIYLARDSAGRDKENGVPVELADFCIRAMDALEYWGVGGPLLTSGLEAGDKVLQKIDTVDTVCQVKDMPLETLLHTIICEISGVETRGEFAFNLLAMMVMLFAWCDAHDINLYFTIKRKMAYNKTRSYRHGGKRV